MTSVLDTPRGLGMRSAGAMQEAASLLRWSRVATSPATPQAVASNPGRDTYAVHTPLTRSGASNHDCTRPL